MVRLSESATLPILFLNYDPLLQQRDIAPFGVILASRMAVPRLVDPPDIDRCVFVRIVAVLTAQARLALGASLTVLLRDPTATAAPDAATIPFLCVLSTIILLLNVAPALVATSTPKKQCLLVPASPLTRTMPKLPRRPIVF